MKNYFNIETGLIIEMIKEFIKEIVGFIFRFSRVPFLIREVICKNKVTIVLYHNPEAEIFKKHIDYLSRRYNFIPLEKLVNAIYNKNWSDIPPKSLIVAIDDGFKENYKLLEIFKHYKVYPTIYICSHIVNTNRKFWFKAGFPKHFELKRCNNEKRLKALKKRIGYEPQKQYPNRQALNLKEIEQMTPYVDFQSHSNFHPIFSACNNDECREEIKQSKVCLKDLLNKNIEHFSYPNGDYSEREVEYLKKFGYRSGRTLDLGWNDINTNPFKLKAMGLQDNASINILCGQISRIFGYFRYLRWGSFNGKHPPFI